MKTLVITLLLIVPNLGSLAQSPASSRADTSTLSVIPWPHQIKPEDGVLTLPADATIAVADRSLLPLANVLAEELQALGACKPRVLLGKSRAGNIALEISPRLPAGGYSLQVNKNAHIKAQDPTAASWATATLLQLLSTGSQTASLPKLSIDDQPSTEFRGLMIDVARQPHTIATLKKLVELCRWYKIRYLQLHLCDDQSFTFPSTAFPQLPTANRHFSLKELQELESFATQRGVVILPELEMPGHASAFITAMPELACEPRGATLCPGRTETIRALDTLIGEACAVFQASPYFHIGADEVGKDAWAHCKHCQARMAEAGLTSPEELYRDFLVRMHAVVKKHGRKTIVWEGFAREGKIPIPHDITVMVFESLYNRPDHLVQDGYKIINTAWQPLYVVNGRNWAPKYIYGWNYYRWENWWDKSQAFPNGINVPPTPLILGAQMCAWEQSDSTEVPSLRQRLAAMSERTWNPQADTDFLNFSNRLAVADQRLDSLLNIAK